jgi:FAD/FMN-containing dehydrogenase
MTPVHTPADVRRAVLTARSSGLRVAVRATGHGTLAEPSPGTLLIDTSRMNSVFVDPDRRTARVGPGATWGDVIEAAAPFGLAPVLGTSTTVGVTGFTFGGGHGFLSRKHGLAADNLIRADVVTADGEMLTAREDRRSGLFWALRGAGGSFGVATSLEFGLHPVREVFGGSARFDRGLAPHLLAYSATATIGGTAPRRFELLRDVPGDDVGPLAPHVTGGSFLNFLKDTSRTRDAYTTADFARLLELKGAYDPDDVFGVGHRIGRACTAGAIRYRAAA